MAARLLGFGVGVVVDCGVCTVSAGVASFLFIVLDFPDAIVFSILNVF